MTEPIPEVMPTVPAEGTSSDGLSPEYNRLAAISDGIMNIVRDTTTAQPWTVQQDVDGTYYIAGAPDTKVVADNLSKADAEGIVAIMSNAWDYSQEIHNLAKIITDPDNPDPMLELVREYHEELGRLQGTIAPIPSVSVAGDLNFLHVGSYLKVGEHTQFPIYGVTAPEGDDLVSVATYDGRTLLLAKDTPIQIEPPKLDPASPQIASAGPGPVESQENEREEPS